MISLNNITIAFSGINLFEDISFIINDRDRIGLVGKNGAGKTTLLRIIYKIIEPDYGNVVIPNNNIIGFLPQEMVINSKKSILDEALDAFSDILELKKKIEKYSAEISSRSDHHSQEYLDIIVKLNDASVFFNMHGGNSMKADTEKVLKGLGFNPDDFDRPVSEFSSGWQMRIELAKILLRKPDVILLDEPTNHLDIESIQWLEDYLINYSGAVVLVSHDRAFLDNVTRRTIEISLGRLFDYKANYSDYVKLREERIEQQIASFNNQQKEIKDIEKFIERFRYKATKARQVQSRIKKLNKMDIIEIDEADHSAIHFRFPPAPHSGNVVLEVKNLLKKFDDKLILNNISFNILKGERIAFVGRNGEGKTTLTRIITGEIGFDGFVKLGHNVSVGYYAQNQSEFLDTDKTVLQTLDDIAVGDVRKDIRTILGSFLFSGETIDKKVKVLSGGEKSRLALAKLLLSPVNLLILDEPTNHLDMTSKDILKNALIRFDGALIIVSHDRDFLQGLTDKIFEFKNHSVKEYIGDIYEFIEVRKISSLHSLEFSAEKKEPASKDKLISDSQILRERKKTLERELKKINREIALCEKNISDTENRISEIENLINNPEFFRDFSNSSEVINELKQLNQQLKLLMNKWEALIEDAENFKN